MDQKDKVSVTPLFGGRSDTAVCSLLEFGNARILLDCGRNATSKFEDVLAIARQLKENGGIDAILLSHADLQHLGAMPLICGYSGLEAVPVLCTLPVYNFGRVLLYDLYLNMKMEVSTNDVSVQDEVSDEASPHWDLEDIDLCFSKVNTVKYNQLTKLDACPNLMFTACPSGRTMGGSIWKIQYGASTVLYAMDVNLRKDTLLDGVMLDALPSGVSLLIMEGGSSHRVGSGGGAGNGAVSGKRGSTVGMATSTVIPNILETVRNQGNVLFPCESCGRTLELLLLLNQHWSTNKGVQQYPIFFLSHMSENIVDFARCQLEWMGDNICKSFYNGKPNPFLLPHIITVTSMKEIDTFKHVGIDHVYTGPKIVVASDASMNVGLSMEVLVKWGGDPKSCVIFTDYSDPGSLAAQLRALASAGQPCVATIRRPQKVPLVGEELAAHYKEEEENNRIQIEAERRVARELELTELSKVGRSTEQALEEGIDQGDDDLTSDEDEEGDGGMRGQAAVTRKRKAPLTKEETLTTMAQYTVAKFKMFESKTVQMGEVGDGAMDRDADYGSSVDDLHFENYVNSASSRPKLAHRAAEELVTAVKSSAQLVGASRTDGAVAATPVVPTKVIATSVRTLFTCQFVQAGLSPATAGRADFRILKTFLAKISPKKLVIVKGQEVDTNALLTYTKTLTTLNASGDIEAFAPLVSERVSVELPSKLVKLVIPHQLVPTSMHEVTAAGGGGTQGAVTLCTVAGRMKAVDAVVEGSALTSKEHITAHMLAPIATTNDKLEILASGTKSDQVHCMDAPLSIADLELSATSAELRVGLVSVGEVLLNHLKVKLESAGITVAYQLQSDAVRSPDTGSGMMLKCSLTKDTGHSVAESVIIRKESDFGFVVDGTPCAVYYKARKILYEHFAFV